MTLDELIEGLEHMRLMIGRGDVKVVIEDHAGTTNDYISHLDDTDDVPTIVLEEG